jgi:hypothetical protein
MQWEPLRGMGESRAIIVLTENLIRAGMSSEIG